MDKTTDKTEELTDEDRKNGLLLVGVVAALLGLWSIFGFGYAMTALSVACFTILIWQFKDDKGRP